MITTNYSVTELFPASLLQSNSRAPAVLFDELDARLFKRLAYNGESCTPRLMCFALKLPNRYNPDA